MFTHKIRNNQELSKRVDSGVSFKLEAR